MDKIRDMGVQFKIALFSAISFGLMFFELRTAFFPGYLTLDLSDVLAVLTGFIMGPMAGVFIELIKNFLHVVFKSSSTAGVGELANFIIGSAYVVSISLVYRRFSNARGILAGSLLATVAIAMAGIAVNYYLLIPFYTRYIPIDQFLELSASFNPSVTDVGAYIVFITVPYNLVKGLLISAVTFMIYRKATLLFK